MPVQPGESIDPEATRNRVLETAEELFYLKGITAVGIAEIAEAAGASKASLYKNFGSKEGLVEATLRQRSERVARWLHDGVATYPPGIDRVLAVFDLLAEWFRERRFRGCAMVSAAAEARAAETAPTRLARVHLQTYRDLLERCLDETGVKHAHGLARQLLMLVEGATVISAIDADPSPAVEAREAAEALVVAATSPPEAPWTWEAPQPG